MATGTERAPVPDIVQPAEAPLTAAASGFETPIPEPDAETEAEADVTPF